LFRKRTLLVYGKWDFFLLCAIFVMARIWRTFQKKLAKLVEFSLWKKQIPTFCSEKEHHLFIANGTLFWDWLITFELKLLFSFFLVLFRTSNFRPYLKVMFFSLNVIRLILSIPNV
jgi:hypothetical protein